TLHLGSVRFIRPSAAFPEIRLRYTPAAGLVYGASPKRMTEKGLTDDPVLGDRIIYNETKRWRGYSDKGMPTETNPGAIYAGFNGESWGYLDDECDGTVSVELVAGGQTLRAYAYIGAGPPSFAPDGLPIRTVSDELEQAMFGPDVAASAVSDAEVEEIVRRAFETVR